MAYIHRLPMSRYRESVVVFLLSFSSFGQCPWLVVKHLQPHGFKRAKVDANNKIE